MNAVTQSESAALAAPIGLVLGLDIDAYHSGPGISKSGLDSIDANPFIYYSRHLDPRRPEHVTKAGQLEGSLAHCAILEPDQFSARYVVGPALNRNTKAWKEFVESESRIAIQPDQYETAMRQAESVRRLPEIAESLRNGRAEVSAYWNDPLTGELCRCRPDWAQDVGTAQTILLDVKTCSDASPEDFRRQIARKRYHVQHAFYSDGYGIAAGREVLAFVFVAVESEWPYAANALMLDEVGIEQGRKDYRRNLDTYAQCRRSGEWPGYGNEIQIINLPNWAITE